MNNPSHGSWVRWTIAQGLSGTLNCIIQKLVGTITTSAADARFATAVLGVAFNPLDYPLLQREPARIQSGP